MVAGIPPDVDRSHWIVDFKLCGEHVRYEFHGFLFLVVLFRRPHSEGLGERFDLLVERRVLPRESRVFDDQGRAASGTDQDVNACHVRSKGKPDMGLVHGRGPVTKGKLAEDPPLCTLRSLGYDGAQRSVGRRILEGLQPLRGSFYR